MMALMLLLNPMRVAILNETGLGITASTVIVSQKTIQIKPEDTLLLFFIIWRTVLVR